MRHLEEGEIHAWLDGATSPDEGVRIEAHVASCAECSANVATARGLIAGASRILLALDSIPGGVIPASPSASAPSRLARSTGSEPTGPVVSDLDVQRTKASQRRQIQWFSRRWTRVAAGLMLAAGIAGVALRDGADQSRRVTVEIRGEPAPPIMFTDSAAEVQGAVPTRDLAGVAVGRSSAAVNLPPAMSVGPATPAASPASAGAGAPPASRVAREESAPGATLGERTAPPTVAGGSATGAVADAFVRSRQAAVNVPPPVPAVPAASSGTPAAAAKAQAPVGQAVAGAGGGGGGRFAAADSVSPLQARLSRTEQEGLRLQSVVVTGAAAAREEKAAAFVTRASADTLAGACFALDLAAPAQLVRGEMPLPRTMRIRLADLQNIATDAVRADTRDANLQQSLRRGVRSAPPPSGTVGNLAVEPVETVEWEATATDSVIARRLMGVDVIVLRLAVAGDQVTGTAAAQTATTPPVRVAGRRIACDGSF